jgi:hypothetical protein
MARVRLALLAVLLQFRQVPIDFTLQNHPTPEKRVIETMAGGVAAFDYDNDGRTDIFFTNGASVPAFAKKHPNRLFRNLGRMKFQDVTAAAGLAGEGYSNGVAAGDYDNDGRVDLFVAGVRANRLYRNLGNGRFADVTARAGIRSDVWAITGGWFDYDRDGRLDLFVVNYLKWSAKTEPWCGDEFAKVRAYCHPRMYDGLPNALYRNRGDGTFEDVSSKTGIAKHVGKGMSLAIADYDLDGFPDVFVTNDKLPNFLFRNLGGRAFDEVGLEAGVAMVSHGKPISAMGADFRDYDNDGRPDIAVAALAGELYPLFRNEGGGFFRDATYRSGLGPLSVRRSGWSVGLFDFDNDGWKDLFTSSSHVNDTVSHFENTQYRLRNALFVNRAGKFAEAVEVGPAGAHRGSAFADFNGDGRIDVVVSALSEPAQLWENTTPAGNTWLVVKLRGTKSNRDGIGTRVRAGAQHNVMSTAVGYCSSSHAGVHFGTGSAQTVEVEIVWPSGVVQKLGAVRTKQVLTATEP